MLAACRALHQAGYEVTAASSTALAAAQWSRACSRRIRVPDARESSEGFVGGLREELKRRPYATLIAGSDSSLLAISELRERIQPLTRLGLPARSAVESAMHRERLEQAAGEVGMPTARTIRCSGPEQALRAVEELGLPLALKSVDAAQAGAQAVASVPKGQFVSTLEELRAAAGQFKEGMLLQQWVAGDVVSVGGVFAGGHLLGAAVSRYLRMWPPESGSVAFSETVSPPSGLLEAVSKLMLAVGWEGIFELELIHAKATELVPIDLNPRPYGSMALANAAGAPLAAIWCDWLLESRLPTSPGRGGQPQPVVARAGVRYRWEDGDLRYVVAQLRRERYRSAIGALRPHGRVAHAHFQAADPLPMLARVLYLGKRLIKHR